jgi:hypothetical protein
MEFLEARQHAERLSGSGFKYYGFISYPRSDAAMADFAHRFHEGLEGLVRRNLPPLQDDPADRVFLDQRAIRPGMIWEDVLGQGLCQSLTLLSLCVPMYANSLWCGREWNAACELAAARFPNGLNTIFVVRLGELTPHPVIMRIQQYYAPKKALQWLHRTASFQGGLTLAFQHILHVLANSQAAVADCGDYRIPARTAFDFSPTPPTPNRTP